VQKLKESQIEQACLQYLNYFGWYCFKFKDQTEFRDGKFRKPLPFQVNGVADAFAIKNGVQIWIEFKTQTGVQSIHQKLFQKNIEMNGGIYLLIRSVDELKEKLANI
jgi:hypothetical protein